jgi:hypothetical protein
MLEGITGVMGAMLDSVLLQETASRPNKAANNIDFIEKIENIRLCLNATV